MKPLVAKEIRLLQPAWLMALLLAGVPVWLHPGGALAPFILGLIMLSLSVFGREFSLQTFGLLLSEPIERRRIWRLKVGLLAIALLSVLLVWWVSCSACLSTESRRFTGSFEMTFGVAAAVVAFAGGLWTTLLLRQIAGGFFLTVLIPGWITMLMHEAKTWQVLLVLGIYSAAGYWWARHHFMRAQDTGWTGGEVTMPFWPWARSSSVSRQRRPWAALCWKEMRLQQVALVGMAWLLLMHLGVVALRKLYAENMSDTLRVGLEVFSGIWLVVPLLASSLSVAEERKLGTLGQQLCLPVSRRIQFAMKFFVNLGIGGVLCALLICVAEGLGYAVGASHSMFDQKTTVGDVAGLFLGFMGFAFIGFYASTLARNVVQAMAVAVVTTIGIVILGALAAHPGEILHLWLWRGYLVYLIGWPSLFMALLWLAWRNFRSETGTDHLWRHNAIVLGSVFAGVVVLTSLVYNRVWEFLTPTDPPPGITRITGAKPTVMTSRDGSAITAILPDGRLWVDILSYQPGLGGLSFGERMGFELGGHWRVLSGNRIVAGSNWVHAVANLRETVAIRSDGTLWISEKPSGESVSPGGGPRSGLTPFGSDTNWQDVVQEEYASSVVLLKKDGTLWRLGTNSFSQKDTWPGLRSFAPQRLVPDTGWNRILAGGETIYVWKDDGSAWAIRSERTRGSGVNTALDRFSGLDNTRWLSATSCGQYQVEVGARDDGTLWNLPSAQVIALSRKAGLAPPQLMKISPGTEWSAVAGTYETLGARRSDGSIWHWIILPWNRGDLALRRPPVRLGLRNDWVAVAGAWDGLFSLGADGNLYYWHNRPSWYGGETMLAPSRKPELVGNVFGNSQSP